MPDNAAGQCSVQGRAKGVILFRLLFVENERLRVHVMRGGVVNLLEVGRILSATHSHMHMTAGVFANDRRGFQLDMHNKQIERTSCKAPCSRPECVPVMTKVSGAFVPCNFE